MARSRSSPALLNADNLPKGITRSRYGFRVCVKVRGQQREHRFPPGTKLRTMLDWRGDMATALRNLHRAQQDALPISGSLAEDIRRYLPEVSAMPTFAQRTEHLLHWQAALGADTPRSAITASDIRTVLQRWRQTLGAATCNKRRTALMHLWSILDGKGARNPVRDVPKFRAPDALPRGRDIHALDALLKAAPACRSRACCRVILWTGARPIELLRAQPEDIDLERRTAVIRTAKGGRPRVVPLTSQAVSAWREFISWDCWEDVPQASPLGRWLKDHTGLEDLRVYDLRHSYGTALALRETRLDVIGGLMGHSTLELTKRYTLAALSAGASTATSRLARKTAGSLSGSHPQKRKKPSK